MRNGFIHINENTIVNLRYIVSVDFAVNDAGRQCMIKTCNGEVFMTDDEMYIDHIAKKVILDG